MDMDDAEFAPFLKPATKSKTTSNHVNQPTLPFTRMDIGQEESAEPVLPSPPSSSRIARYWNSLWHADKQAAMYAWTSTEDLDAFLRAIYRYHQGNGFSAIALDRLLNILGLLFVFYFTTFLVSCIDYSHLKTAHSLLDVTMDGCPSIQTIPSFILLLDGCFLVYITWIIYRLFADLPHLRRMHTFYAHLLNLSDQHLPTTPWSNVVQRLTRLRQHTPTTVPADPLLRLDAHTITNRIMRKENYLIAMFTKDLFDLRLPGTSFSKSTILTQSLEWNLLLCISDAFFDHKTGHVRADVLKEVNRKLIANQLTTRFRRMAIINAILAPFIAIYLLLFFFFTYFVEYQKHPESIGSRQYTRWARWQIRQFDELPHSFQHRLNRSYLNAVEYLNQFPSTLLAMMARFIAFIAGSFIAVLALLTLMDQELLLNLEITPDRSVLFYLTLFGSIFAIARGLVPDEHVAVYEPEKLLLDVIKDTNYLPLEWKRYGLHTLRVRAEFTELFDYRISILLRDILSVLWTPIVLYFALPNTSQEIVDFVRRFTIHVEAVGHVCSFAVFDSVRPSPLIAVNAGQSRPESLQPPLLQIDNNGQLDEYDRLKGNKMEQSMLNFKKEYPDWQPQDPMASQILERVSKRVSALGIIEEHPGQSPAKAHEIRQPELGQTQTAKRSYLLPTGKMNDASTNPISNITIFRRKMSKPLQQQLERAEQLAASIPDLDTVQIPAIVSQSPSVTPDLMARTQAFEMSHAVGHEEGGFFMDPLNVSSVQHAAKESHISAPNQINPWQQHTRSSPTHKTHDPWSDGDHDMDGEESNLFDVMHRF